jgi:5-methylthioadenosine/S-adenosylhomocysteine deaminase
MIKLTTLFGRIQARDPRVFPAWEVLRMATIEGGQAGCA